MNAKSKILTSLILALLILLPTMLVFPSKTYNADSIDGIAGAAAVAETTQENGQTNITNDLFSPMPVDEKISKSLTAAILIVISIPLLALLRKKKENTKKLLKRALTKYDNLIKQIQDLEKQEKHEQAKTKVKKLKLTIITLKRLTYSDYTELDNPVFDEVNKSVSNMLTILETELLAKPFEKKKINFNLILDNALKLQIKLNTLLSNLLC